MKLDSHVHTHHSGNTSIYPLSLIMRESYNTPEGVYRLAKQRGMDVVTTTDHDQISGALSLAHYPDVIVGSEVTDDFPRDGVSVHQRPDYRPNLLYHLVRRPARAFAAVPDLAA